MWRIIMYHIYCYWIKGLCIKLVIWNKCTLWCTVRKTSNQTVSEGLALYHIYLYSTNKNTVKKSHITARCYRIWCQDLTASITNGANSSKLALACCKVETYCWKLKRAELGCLPMAGRSNQISWKSLKWFEGLNGHTHSMKICVIKRINIG
jgi:hypothetical protein